jgi:hypothetical protein
MQQTVGVSASWTSLVAGRGSIASRRSHGVTLPETQARSWRCLVPAGRTSSTTRPDLSRRRLIHSHVLMHFGCMDARGEFVAMHLHAHHPTSALPSVRSPNHTPDFQAYYDDTNGQLVEAARRLNMGRHPTGREGTIPYVAFICWSPVLYLAYCV